MDYPYIHPQVPSTTCHRFNGGPCAAHKNNNDSMFTQLIRRFYRASCYRGVEQFQLTFRSWPGSDVSFTRGRTALFLGHAALRFCAFSPRKIIPEIRSEIQYR